MLTRGAGLLTRRPEVFVAHGSDDSVTPYELGQQSVSLGQSAGLRVEFVVHEEGHTIPIEVMNAVGQYMKASIAATTPAPAPSMARPSS